MTIHCLVIQGFYGQCVSSQVSQAWLSDALISSLYLGSLNEEVCQGGDGDIGFVGAVKQIWGIDLTDHV